MMNTQSSINNRARTGVVRDKSPNTQVRDKSGNKIRGTPTINANSSNTSQNTTVNINPVQTPTNVNRGSVSSNIDLSRVDPTSSSVNAEKRNTSALIPAQYHNTPNSSNNQSGNISVVCRYRPLNEKEKSFCNDKLSTEFIDFQNIVVRTQADESVKDSKEGVYKFSFDRIFNPSETQAAVYEFAGKPVVDSILEGFNGTIFAYGQTGSGKTFTMSGDLENSELEGLIPRIIKDIFLRIENASSDIDFTVKFSMIEIYMEKIKDLIDKERINLNVREDKAKGLYIEGLSEQWVTNVEEFLALLKIGNENRTIAFTNMNDNSSRSHSIVIITIHQNNVKDLVAKTGKLYLVDLAGSEKISKTGAEGTTLEEGKSINKSLTTLGMVINALTDGKSTHVPYRDSKLTRVLQESLGGNSKTSLITTCSPSIYNDLETVSTLRFGMRVKSIKNKPKINREVTLAELKLQVDRMEKELTKQVKRNTQLEKFITKKGLEIPKEQENAEKEEDETKEKVKTKEDYEEELKMINLKLEETENQIRELNRESEKKDQQISDLEEEKENYEMSQMDFNHKINSFQDKISRLEKEIQERDNFVYLRFDRKSFDVENRLLEITQKEKLEKQTIIDKYLLIQMEELLRVKPDFEEIARDYKLQLILNNSKEKTEALGTFLPSLNHNDIELIKAIHLDKLPKNSSNGETSEDVKRALEDFKKERQIMEQERSKLIKVLEDKSSELQFVFKMKDELLEKVKLYEKKINPEDKAYVKKIDELEKKLETVNLMYHHITSQKAIVKIECEILERKLRVRQEKISTMEKENQEIKDQIKILNEKVSNQQRQYLKMQSNLKKTIKGGGGLCPENEYKYQRLLSGVGGGGNA